MTAIDWITTETFSKYRYVNEDLRDRLTLGSTSVIYISNPPDPYAKDVTTLRCVVVCEMDTRWLRTKAPCYKLHNRVLPTSTLM